ncbi:hypothetical protein [Crenobacter cavernae]|uniref:Uncharacterized protein n=1 Tax=Crenobacter cavernae TaxID=2290923 RepID=A0ABY0FDM3_9NEIS|nr:hypothetical protein [Crenobacter cavernae]RXZ42718.1 hypothetical protein EBB06_12565 [Crenobacter cavernae]
MKRLALLLPLLLVGTAHAADITPSLIATATRWQAGERVADPGGGVALNIRPEGGPEWGVAYVQHRVAGEAAGVLAVGPRWKAGERWHVGASPQLVIMHGAGRTEARPALTVTGGYNGYHLDLLLTPDTKARPPGAWLWIRTDL